MQKLRCTIPVLLLSFALPAQVTFEFQPREAHFSQALAQQFESYTLLQVPTDSLYLFLQSAGPAPSVLALDFGGQEAFEVELQPYDLRASGYTVRIAEAEGIRTLPPSPNKTYRGQRAGAPGEEVRLTVGRGFLYGYLTRGEATYYIEPAWLLDPDLPTGLFVWYEAADVIAQNLTGTCGTSHSLPPAPQARRIASGCYALGMGLAADYALYEALGSVSATENFMLGVLNNVGTNYNDEFDNEIELKVNGAFISTCATCDPWPASTDASAVLSSFTNWGNNGGFGFSHSLATLWTERNFNGTTIGVAWPGGLCNADRYNACQSFAANAALLRVLQAHEIGHNFSAQHDADGDNTIMAPSVNTSTVWSAASQNAVNSYVSALADFPNCFGPCGDVALPPDAQISTPVINACPGSYVQFLDQSTNNPTAWSWSFTGGTPSTSTEQNPVVYFPDAGVYTATLTVTNDAGASTGVSEAIAIEEGQTRYLFYDAMEGPLDNWSVDNPDNGVTWAVTTVGGSPAGQRAVYVNNYDYDAAGQKDALISPPFDFSEVDNIHLRFDYAYQRYSIALRDQLRVWVSTDGGATFPDEVFFGDENGSGNFATTPDGTGAFLPLLPADWCHAGDFGADCADVDLSAYAGESNVRLKIENTNGFGNNLYIDNVRITASCAILSPPVAALSADTQSGCAPFQVQFTDESTGQIDNWAWSFPGGDPAVSNQQHPTVTYEVPGSYPVMLTVSNSAGSSTATLDNEIAVNTVPDPYFLYQANGLSVAFGNLTDNYTGIKWEFGDGHTADTPDVTHVYDEPGIYTVTLSAENECGTAYYSEVIELVPPPTAGFFSESLSGCAPVLMQFINTTAYGDQFQWFFEGATPSSSTDPDPIASFPDPGTYEVTLIAANDAGADTLTQPVTIFGGPQSAFVPNTTPGSLEVSFANNATDAYSFEWDFGDGSPISTEIAPTHTYNAPGQYTVTLIATNDCGSEASAQHITLVLPPVANIQAAVDTPCAPYILAPLDASSGMIESRVWTAPGANPPASSSPMPVFEYTQPGAYTVVLQVTNAAGLSTDTLSFMLQGTPQAGFTVDTTLGSTAIELADASSGAAHYQWSFGDGNFSTEAAPVHTYATDGTYTVELRVSNGCGADTVSQEVTVVTLPEAGFSVSAESGCAPFTVILSPDTAEDQWDYTYTANGAIPPVSTDVAPTFSFPSAGVYAIVQEVSNAVGTSRDTVEVLVANPPQASFTISNEPGSPLVALTSMSDGTAGHYWDFGDGNSSTAVHPAHTYAEDGEYLIRLQVENACGADTATQLLTVATPPVADFNQDTVAGCAPLSLAPSDHSSLNTMNWSWVAPGAAPSIAQGASPEFVYPEPGIYTLYLEASNAVGASLDSMVVHVQDVPVADFSYALNGFELALDNQSENAHSFLWGFGDGSSSPLPFPSHTYSAPGVYPLTLAAVNNCGQAVAGDTVTVLPPVPAASFEVEATEGCVPFEVAYTSTTAYADHYYWTFPGGEPAHSTEAAPVVTYAAPGVYGATLAVSNSTGSDTLVVNQAVEANLPPVAGFSFVVEAATVYFENQSDGAETFIWDFGNGTTSQEADPTVDYGAAGSFEATLIAENNCGRDTLRQTVVISGSAPVPHIQVEPVAPLCPPITLELYANSLGGAADEWAWHLPGGTPETAVGDTVTVAYLDGGIYSVTLIGANAYGADTLVADGLLQLLEPPAADFEFTAVEDEVSFNNTSTGTNVSYLWDFGDGYTSAEADPVHTFAATGVYPVLLTAANSCDTASALKWVEVMISSAEEQRMQEVVHIFPNPNRGIFTLSVASPSASRLRMQVFNTVGQAMGPAARASLQSGQWQYTVDGSQWPAGLYWVVLTVGESRIYRRVVVE